MLVAEKFGKEHKNVLRDIDNLVAQNSAAKSYFVESVYENRGKSYPMYIMDKDGFTLLAMGFTGKKAISFKLEYIEAFNKMENMLSSDEYILMRGFKIMENKIKLLETESSQKDEIIEMKNDIIVELTPDAEYARKTLLSIDTLTTTQIAKQFGWSAKKLNEILKSFGVQYRIGGQWVLRSKYQDKGYTKTHTFTEDIGGKTRTWHNTVWTESGRMFIHSLINNSYLLDFSA